jgi:hypothetical protein
MKEGDDETVDSNSAAAALQLDMEFATVTPSLADPPVEAAEPTAENKAKRGRVAGTKGKERGAVDPSLIIEGSRRRSSVSTRSSSSSTTPAGSPSVTTLDPALRSARAFAGARGGVIGGLGGHAQLAQHEKVTKASAASVKGRTTNIELRAELEEAVAQRDSLKAKNMELQGRLMRYTKQAKGLAERLRDAGHALRRYEEKTKTRASSRDWNQPGAFAVGEDREQAKDSMSKQSAHYYASKMIAEMTAAAARQRSFARQA